jgi:oligopeptidase A
LNNPLLHPAGLPRFEQIKPEMIEPAIKSILADNRELIKQLEQLDQVTWNNLVQPLELADDRLSKAWSPVRHLNSVKSSDALRDAYNACLTLLSDYSTEVGQNQSLYQGYQHLAESPDFEQLDPARQKTIKDSLQHFELAGVGLDQARRKQFQAVQSRLSELQSQYENNLLDATQSWSLLLDDEQRLGGLPGYALSMLQQSAQAKSLDGYRLTLDMPCYIAIMTYAEDRELRKTLYQAYSTRASDQGFTEKRWDNAAIMVEILQKRDEKAKLIGYQDFAQLSLQTKMARDTREVIGFLQDLGEKSLPQARAEYAQLEAFARQLGLEGALEAWDVGYYSELQRKQLYAFSDEDLKPYFTDDRVISGLFGIVQRLFHVTIEADDGPVELWHPDVRFYRIKDRNGTQIAQFYLDLYAREHKRGGAWMDECINRYRIEQSEQLPVAYLTCNLTPPIGDEPAQFTHDEVITLFHEFGHGLHHMLTRVDVPEVAGINGVEWDAVELPSQFMENFCWEREALDLFARHYQTDQPLPDELYQKMIAARNYQSAMQMVRQLEFSLFDIKLHQYSDVQSADQIQQVLDEVRDQIAVVKPPAFNRFQNGFSHIFAGGYAAGYYSYKWAEVLSADVFSRFEQDGVLNPQTGQKFLDCILGVGGMRPARDSFVCFMQREPQIDALLRHNGIQLNQAA